MTNASSPSSDLVPRLRGDGRSHASPPLRQVVPDKRAPYERVAQVLAAAQRSHVTIAERRAHRRLEHRGALEAALRAHRRLGDPAEQQDAEREPVPERCVALLERHRARRASSGAAFITATSASRLRADAGTRNGPARAAPRSRCCACRRVPGSGASAPRLSPNCSVA